MDYCLRKARPGEESVVYAMIESRVEWMDHNDIHQWNDTDYLEVYPEDYYKRNLDRLYVLTGKDDGRILSAAVIFDQDDRWDSAAPAFYIHNFVSVPGSRGAGKIFLQLLEDLAENEGVSWLRLDSADDNRKLASYYETLGFEACGECRDGKYHGILRQKNIMGF